MEVLPWRTLSGCVFLLCCQAFWREKEFSGEIVARPSNSCPFSVTFDATSPSGSPALVGFIAGLQAHDWSSTKVSVCVRMCL